MVFFAGTLQEGIQTALQQSKLVVCFVTDGQEESQIWEAEYLTDDSVAPSLEKDAVVLRLEAGSQEAGYLAAIFPLPKTPTLVIIKNGELKEYVAAGTAKDELLKRISRAFSAQAGISQDQAGASTTTPVAQTAATAAETSRVAPTPGRAEQAPASTSTNSTTGATALLTEAERRREAARKEREELERERRRKEKGKLPASDDPAKAKQSDAVKKASQQLAERQRKAREERARVLRLIEDDRAERRARQERERQERNAARNPDRGDAGENGGDGATTATSAVPDDAVPSTPMGRRHDQCAIQVRLFDGSTIRTRFPAGATLARDVRRWIDETRTDNDGRRSPYTFKVILTPQPNRAIDQASEEERSLGNLGLAPSATLVLTPVDRYSSSYTNVNAGLTNPVSRLVTAVLAFVVNILGGIAGALGGLGGSGARADGSGGGGGGGADAPGRGDAGGAARQDANSQSSSAAQATGRDGSGRIKGFQNPDDSKKDYQLYNGNSVSSSAPLQTGRTAIVE